jgi:hypothetical protein
MSGFKSFPHDLNISCAIKSKVNSPFLFAQQEVFCVAL